MEKKYKIEFTEMNVQDSVTYTLVTDFNLVPNILKAEISGDGSGIMILSLSGEERDIKAGVKKMEEMGFAIHELANHITRDKQKCFSCGACMSICPTKSFSFDPVTWEVHLDIDTCIACGACIDACSVKALNLMI